MSLLTATEIEQAFGATTVLAAVSLRVEWGQKLGLVGANGCGKTTLVRILSGVLECDGGRVSIGKGVRVGYLRQQNAVDSGSTVLQEAEAAFAHVHAMEARLADLESAMATSSDAPALSEVMEEYGGLRDRFDALGGYTVLRDVPDVLSKLGFARSDFSKSTDALSGGEKTRLALARLLLSAPDLILMDEPTNHLDIGATEWLEEYLKSFGGGLIVVSHDRYFLNRVVDSVAELANGTLKLYKGNFDAYRLQRAAQLEKQAELAERDQQEIERLMTFFQKWRSTPSKKNQAVSRYRQAVKLQATAVLAPPAPNKRLKVSIRPGRRSGNEVIVAETISHGYGGRTLFSGLDLVVERGDRIGLVGMNGSGKSTLLRLILGLEMPDSGSVRMGANVTIGYFAQEASDLDPEGTVLEHMFEAGAMAPVEARTHLGKFQFSGDDVYKQVSMLSGGEKNRLSLARLTWVRPNVLILDEPTNHLDIDSREALCDTLRGYDGTLLLVSHDRWLLDEVSTVTMEIEAGRIHRYLGPYHEYRTHKAQRAVQPRVRSTPVDAPTKSGLVTTGANPLTVGMNSHQLSKERQRARKALDGVEAEVQELEDWIQRIEEALSTPMRGEDVTQLVADHNAARTALDDAMARWEAAITYANGIGAGQ